MLQNITTLGLPWMLLEGDKATMHPSLVSPKCHAGDISMETLLSLDRHSNTMTTSGGPSFTAKLNAASHAMLS